MSTGLDERIAAAAATVGTSTTEIVAAEAEPTQTLGQWFTGAEKTLTELLAKSNIDLDRFKRALFMTYRNTRNLNVCSIASIRGAVLTCAYYGLEPGPLGHAWLIPYWNGQAEEYECEFQLGYKGELVLHRRAGIDVQIRRVHEGDEFEYGYGTKPYINHKPKGDPKDRETICRYGVAFPMAGGRPYSWVVWPSEIEERRQLSAAVRAGAMQSPWFTFTAEMEDKTVVRIGDKWIPSSVAVQEAILADGRVLNDTGELLSGTPVIHPHDLPAIVADGTDPRQELYIAGAHERMNAAEVARSAVRA